MIHVLHGENTEEAERFLKSLFLNFKGIPKIYLSDKDNLEEFTSAVYAQDLFEKQKVIVVRNWLSAKKINLAKLKTVPETRTIIFVEDAKVILPANFKSTNNVQIEEFKPSSSVFWFLDSLSPDFRQSTKYLSQVDTDKTGLLVWNLLFRVSLMIASKSQVKREKCIEFFRRNIQDWQWDKIKKQSNLFTLDKLIDLYRGLLRLDYATKSGISSVDEKSLITILLLKYLSL